MNITFEDIADVFPKLTENIKNTKVSISCDTRSYNNESLFICIPGEKFNPLSFLKDNLLSNSTIIVYQSSPENEKLVDSFKENHSKVLFVAVKNVIEFMLKLSNLIAQNFEKDYPRILYISGSNGKTTTKEMSYELLKSLGFKVFKTIKNNNNQIGVPLTMFQILEDDYDYGVVELGSNHPGEIPLMADLIQMNFALTTNIGHTHLEFFHNLENVFKEESYILNSVIKSKMKGKRFFKNVDDEYLKSINNDDFIINYGENSNNYKFNIHIDSVDITFDDESVYKISNDHIIGKHNFLNLSLAFLVVGFLCKKRWSDVARSCSDFEPRDNRSQWIKINNQQTHVFLDAYNANPSSMMLAIEAFKEYVQSKKDQKVLCILGDMNELGKNSKKYHQDLGNFLNELHLDADYIFVGRFAECYKESFENESKTYDAIDQLEQNMLKQYDYVFIKGSRSLQLESVLDIS